MRTLLSIVVLAAPGVLASGLMGCGDDDGPTGSRDAGPTGDALADGGGGPTSTYHLLDLDAGCTDHVIAELAFDATSRTGTFTPRACAPAGTPSGPASTLEYHARFPDFLVADGRVLVEASASEAANGIAPVVYCREGDNQTTIQLLRFALSTDVGAGQCDIEREYRDPVDGYYNGGSGGASCSSLSYMRSATQLVWMDTDRIGADIALDQGTATAGHPGVASVHLFSSSGATITPPVLCWTNPS